MDFDSIEKLRRKYPARLTRGKAIKLYCKELCCCGDYQSWDKCTQTSCFLWAFRKGVEQSIGKQENNSKINASVKDNAENSPLNDGLEVENGK